MSKSRGQLPKLGELIFLNTRVRTLMNTLMSTLMNTFMCMTFFVADFKLEVWHGIYFVNSGVYYEYIHEYTHE